MGDEKHHEQLQILLVLRSESQYFEGTSLSKMSDNEHPSSRLSDSEIFAVKATPAYAIPQLGKRVKDFCETVSPLRTKQTGNVFKDKIPRSLGFKDSCKLKKEVASFISERKPFSSGAERLERESANDKVKISKISCIVFLYVAIKSSPSVSYMAL